MTIEERIESHDAALEVALEFQKAGQDFYRERENASKPPSDES